ncbi:hypothetical protein LSCM1_01477 [Leishmania martiniquensis]|uniref:Kinetoplast ribosomal PPR-repeat containing protein 3 n=1 Tax=Leishmania martiniquensis TaxID=1580590 RepID=A0A836GX55_9TRYP|nr:hypothetical protein LSCM1_01477 [Leishmania martiniquensis]
MHRYHFRLRRCRILAVPCGPSLYALVQGGRAVSTPSASPLRFDFDRRQHRAPGRKEEEPQPQRQSRLSRSTEVLLDACDGERHLAQQSPLSPVTSHHDSTIANVAHERAPGLLHGEQRCTARSKVASPPPFEGARYTRRQARQRGPAISAAMLMRSLQERNSPYVATLRKRVVPRHTGTHGAVEDRNSAHQSKAQRLAEADLRSEEARSMKRDGYDPALVVHIDSRRRQVRLNDVQRELIWTARQEQYHRLLQRVVACLQSHRSPIEKCQTLYGLHDEVIEKHMRLRADTYEDMLHTLYSVGVQRGGGAGQPGKGSLSLSAGPVSGGAVWEDCSWKEDLPLGVGGALPAELARPLAASSTVLSPHGIEKVWEMYRYLVDSGTDPTPRILQYVMGLLEHASVSLAVARSHSAANSGGIPATPGRRGARSSGLLLVEAKAHSLMMDADRFHLAPTEYTVNSYIAICEACDVMHLAVARVTDYQTRQERQASPGMYARLLTGLVRCGHYTDAMAVVTTMQNVAMTTYLVNAVLQAARYSRDPASVFTFYRALFFVPSNPLRVGRDRHTERGSSAGKAPSLGRASPTSRSATGLAPSLATFSIMAEVMLQTQDYTELTFLVAEMRHYGVRGNGLLLNKLLKMMHIAGRPPSEVRALQSAMDAKQVRVFDENRSGGHAPSLQ